MKKTYKKFCFKHNSQFGGMLLEMMLSVALAAITIPFVARYQKNTIERARNVAVVKQMDIVRGALERCIVENRSIFLLQTGDFVFSENNIDPSKADCLILSDDDGIYGLINYGLTPEFVNDYKNDYSLRIRKSNDDTGQAVLQGIVLLKNGNVNTLSTREIVNLGGGQVGFTDGNYVRGGFNAFSTEKTNYGLTTDDQGIIQTTDTMRGDSKYLWRTADASREDRTMLSFLNLDGHDITQMSGFSARKAYFSNRVTLDSAYPLATSGNPTINTLQFTNRMNLTGTNLKGQNADVRGDLSASEEGSTLTANNNLKVLSESSVNTLTIDCLPIEEDEKKYCGNNLLVKGDLSLRVCANDDTMCMSEMKLNFNDFKVNGNLTLFQIESDSGVVKYSGQAKSSHLRKMSGGKLSATEGENIYYIDDTTASFQEVHLNGSLISKNTNKPLSFNELIKYVVSKEENADSSFNLHYEIALDNRYGAAWLDFDDDNNHDVGFYLKNFRYMQHILTLKSECAAQHSNGCPRGGATQITKCINSKKCREEIRTNCKNTDFDCAKNIVEECPECSN